MAKRRRSSRGFWSGFNEGYDTVGRVAQDIELANAEKEKPESVSGFTQAQGDELNTLGASQDNDITYDPAKGDYVVTSKATGEVRRISPSQRTILYGKDHGRQLSDEEIKAERTSRQASIYSKYGNPEKGMMLEQRAQQGKMGDLQIKSAQRQDKQAEADEQHKAGRKALYDNSYFAQVQRDNAAAEQEYSARKADYDAKIQAGVPPQQLGTPPQQPAKRRYGLVEAMADDATSYAYDAKNGKLNHNDWIGLAKKMDQVETEGYEKALRLGESGAPIDAVAAEFNKSGAIQFDPKNVVSDRTGKTKIRGVDVDTRFITYKDAKGNERTINVTAELAAIQGTKDILTTQFAIKKDQREGQQLGLQGRQVALAENKDQRETKRQDGADQALVDMAEAESKGDTKAYKEARLRAIRNGVKIDKPEAGKSDFTANPMGMGGTVKQISPDGSVRVTPISADGKAGKSVVVPPVGQQQAAVATPKSQAEFDALPSGSVYVDPEDGKRYKKP